MNVLASLRISSGKVAENIRFWRFCGQQTDDAADVVDEAHVQHAVGLVQHQDFDVAQVDRALLHVVQQPARRRDDDVDAAAQFLDLRIDVHAAENRGRAQRLVLAVGAHAFLHLRREFAGRHQDQAADRAARALLVENLQQRQREAGGLAGTRLRRGKEILACQHDRNRLRLNGGGDRVALFGHSTEQLGRKAE